MSKCIKLEDFYTLNFKGCMNTWRCIPLRIIHTLMIVSLFAFLTACVENNSLQNGERKDAIPRNVSVKNSDNQNTNRKSNLQIANRLAQIAKSIPKVKNARAVVFGNYAIVGIDVDANLDRSEVGSIKYSVAESLKHDPYGAQSIVIADPDLNERLKEVGEDVRAGKPGQGILNELADIAGRVMPEIPKNIVEPSNPNQAPEKPKKTLNDSQGKQLNKEQEKQSNQHK